MKSIRKSGGNRVVKARKYLFLTVFSHLAFLRNRIEERGER